jgi:hypothetical protein
VTVVAVVGAVGVGACVISRRGEWDCPGLVVVGGRRSSRVSGSCLQV